MTTAETYATLRRRSACLQAFKEEEAMHAGQETWKRFFWYRSFLSEITTCVLGRIGNGHIPKLPGRTKKEARRAPGRTTCEGKAAST